MALGKILFDRSARSDGCFLFSDFLASNAEMVVRFRNSLFRNS